MSLKFLTLASLPLATLILEATASFGVDPVEVAVALEGDDDCAATDEEGACAWHAIQRRALSTLKADPAPQAGAGAAQAVEAAKAEAAPAVNSSSNVTAGNVTALDEGCSGPWCPTIKSFDEYFDSGVPATMQEGFNKYTEWATYSEGIKIAVTKHNYYEMYHSNIKSKLEQYLPQGYFGWNFKTLGKNFTLLNKTEGKVTVIRHGLITFNLGWWMRGMFWNACVKSLPGNTNFTLSNVTEFDDCVDCPAIMEYTLTEGGLSGKGSDWRITDLVLLKLQ